jgi:isoleucyl-tRNA synthetase
MNKKTGRSNDSVEVVSDKPKSEVALREEEVQSFWAEQEIFEQTLLTPAGNPPVGDFVFYDGPPFATGLPHYGHLLAGTIKDAIPRFWTMNGYRVRRQWGWDCHGLPLENLIEKKLGLATKKDIEEFGIENFNKAAREAVMEYADDWRDIVPRFGRFVDMENDYKTMDSTYTESVWWVFKSLHDKGLVFESFKSMHLCPRCGTTLSNFEVNQGYEDIKDLSVFVELPLVSEPDTALIAWTTTPWTLPGNMAVAVNTDITYALVLAPSDDKPNQKYIVAKERVESVFANREYKIIEDKPGKDLVGLSYQPPYDYLQKQDLEGETNAWKVYHAEFVEVGEEGTGLVHIAPAYGEDDLKLGRENNLPIIHHVDDTGHFKDLVTEFAGQLVKPKNNDDAGISHQDADIEIIRSLAGKGRLFAKEKITHSYPHCWRCQTPLLNYATNSWFVDVPKIKDQLLDSNQKVNWVPEHVGTNRFGKWLEGARDWAVSRQRYWGAPLPIWKNPETGDYKVIGSIAELKDLAPKSGNSYFITRHAESELNTKGILNVDLNITNGVTEKGKAQIQDLVTKLSPEKIDYIYYSPLQRTRETAELLASGLELPNEALVSDDRLLEMRFGEFEGHSVDEYHAFFKDGQERLTKRPTGGENWNDVRQRVGELLYEIESTKKDKKILFVSHNGTMQMIQAVANGDSIKETGKYIDNNHYDLKNSELRSLSFTSLPHDNNYYLDLHRPYIDNFELYENGVRLERVPDVFDCWFESGSMPYGQHHYPFEKTEEFTQQYFPAQFIAEGLDQTRGWFYSLLVLGVALFGKSPFENVIVNGLLLAEDGKKMSKSLQNYPDPIELTNQVGADTIRFYLLASSVIRGEDLNFSEKEVTELQRKNIGRLHNVLVMYQMFPDARPASSDSPHVLDQWIINETNHLISQITAGYKNYELDKATRPITDFIDDLSVWYLRRSRDRLKGDDLTARDQALATLRWCLRHLSLAMAPAMPYYAEYLWQSIKEDADVNSVHLAKWPSSSPVREGIREEMAQTRDIVTAALEARTKAGIKVRQPINTVYGPELKSDLASIVLDELNAKYYQTDKTIKIDTNLTPELLAEGAVRELMRAIQGERKKLGLEPSDQIELSIATDEAGQVAITTHQSLIQSKVGAKAIHYQEDVGIGVDAGDYHFSFSLKKL